MTQCERLAAWLNKGRRITPLQSWKLLGIYRLSARIYDLRKAGMAVQKRLIDVGNAWGETCRVAEYWLEQFKLEG